jgi:hypothetical protein
MPQLWAAAPLLHLSQGVTDSHQRSLARAPRDRAPHRGHVVGFPREREGTDRMSDVGQPPRVADCMQPLRGPLPAFASAESARRRLVQEALRFLAVVAPGTGRLLGAVDRDSLSTRPCCHRLVGRCTVVQHLAPDVAFCFGDESEAEVREAEAELVAEAKVPPSRRIPLVVVDAHLRPLGFLRPAAPGRTASPAAGGASRAA